MGWCCKDTVFGLGTSAEGCTLGTFKPFRYPTSQLYDNCKVLTVRQLFVLQTITRKHVTLEYDAKEMEKRLWHMVCRTQSFGSSLAARHYHVISGHLYNLINKHCKIYPLSRFKCKGKVSQWLMTKSYAETEDLLKLTYRH